MSVAGTQSVDAGESSTSRKKRTRKRKSRTRTEPEDEASEHDEEGKRSSKTNVQPEMTTGEVDDEESLAQRHDLAEDSDTEGKPKEKRKRKRTRGKAKKDEINDNTSAEIIPPLQSQTKISANMSKYMESLDDPHDHSDTLCEKTVNALAYARQYHIARSEWKFNKAKQEYLIRHMLTPPPTHHQPSIENDGSQAEKDKEDDHRDNDADSSVPDQQHWPDEWNECVAKYLATIQGKAKDRLLETLQKAAEQVIPPMPAEVSQADPSSALAPISALSERKTVSFGDLAMAQDAITNGGQEGPSYISPFDIQRRQFQKERATKLLLILQD